MSYLAQHRKWIEGTAGALFAFVGGKAQAILNAHLGGWSWVIAGFGIILAQKVFSDGSGLLLDRSPGLRRLLMGKHSIEGDYLELVNDGATGRLTYYALVSVRYNNGNISINGACYTTDMSKRNIFRSISVEPHDVVVSFGYDLTGDEPAARTGISEERGMGRYTFLLGDGEPLDYSGICINYATSTLFSIRGTRIPNLKEFQRNAHSDSELMSNLVGALGPRLAPPSTDNRQLEEAPARQPSLVLGWAPPCPAPAPAPSSAMATTGTRA